MMAAPPNANRDDLARRLDAAAGYRFDAGIGLRHDVTHREEDYDRRGFSVLLEMQRKHFWYLGRRRFIQAAVERHIPQPERHDLRVLDLGGGCGGWIDYVAERALFPRAELALGDSSADALRFAAEAQSHPVGLYHVDITDLGWQGRWDVIFLLDVLEHVEADEQALLQVRQALAPGGWCIVTVPALKQFWSYNDEIVGHHRRYSTRQLAELAQRAGFEVLDARYFMFLLSPLLAASRLMSSPAVQDLSASQRWQLIERTHRVPAKPLNGALRAVFSAETPLGHWLRFPWGTSALAVLRLAEPNRALATETSSPK